MKLSHNLEASSITDLSNITEEQKQHCRDWIVALRSGEYQQAQGTLRKTQETFCCLGVGCDLIAKAGLGKWKEVVGLDWNFSMSSDQGNMETLPTPAINYYGMEDQTGFRVGLVGHSGLHNLAELNDVYKLSFTDIALIIETAIAGGLKTGEVENGPR